MIQFLKLPAFTLGRFLGFIFTPVGVMMSAWGAQALATGQPRTPAMIGLAMGLTMIIVGVRYIFKDTGRRAAPGPQPEG